MTTRSLVALLFVSFLLLAGGGPAGGEADLLGLINAYRAENGLGPLTPEPRLTAAAEWKAADMRLTGPDHQDSLGRDAFERMTAFGYGDPLHYSRGEVLAVAWAGSAAIDGWKASAAHNAALLLPHFTVVGIGRSGDNWAVNFGHYWGTPPKPEEPKEPTLPVGLPRTGGGS